MLVSLRVRVQVVPISAHESREEFIVGFVTLFRVRASLRRGLGMKHPVRTG
ncbi:hypothetical protein DFR69_113164 [Nocardia neocaledoniensis]|uniref:Uncharacterized protein n=1 Tax=Nocardia neocaledoniensis TaxID=236511 RepID=A0A317N5M1_9NOCA|nr:hypothetical protein DFR69_113164 [Nocardia neocaledoniensis]